VKAAEEWRGQALWRGLLHFTGYAQGRHHRTAMRKQSQAMRLLFSRLTRVLWITKLAQQAHSEPHFHAVLTPF